MKLYSLIEVNGKPYLREKNPLEGILNAVSESAYRDHERQYIEAALPFPGPFPGRFLFTEDELYIQWQFREKPNLTWIDVSEPAFIDTKPSQYRQIFKLINPETFQQRVKNWVISCFGPEYAVNKLERALRYLEESVELVQSLGVEKDLALKVLIRAYGRPVGEVEQEFGGVMVTLAALAAAAEIDVKSAGEIQINQNITNSEKIRAKHLLKIKEGIAI